MGWTRIILILLFFISLGPTSSLMAQETERRVIVEDIPSLKKIRRVAAEETHSGFPVPRYVSLKYGRINGRQGPSLRHPVLWQYQRKGLPLIVVAEMDIWRKVRDLHGDESWVRKQALTGETHVVALKDTNIYARAKDSSRVKAVASQEAVLQLIECKDDDWCLIRSSAGHKGWAKRDILWGVEPL